MSFRKPFEDRSDLDSLIISTRHIKALQRSVDELEEEPLRQGYFITSRIGNFRNSCRNASIHVTIFRGVLREEKDRQVYGETVCIYEMLLDLNVNFYLVLFDWPAL